MGLQDQSSFERGIEEVRAELHALELAVERLRRITASLVCPSTPQITPVTLRLIVKARRARGQVFGSTLFADPAWDMLLEAYIAHLTETKLSVTALCDCAGVPATTALRWLGALEREGWLKRKADPFDARQTQIELTAKGSADMSQYFSAISPSVLPI